MDIREKSALIIHIMIVVVVAFLAMMMISCDDGDIFGDVDNNEYVASSTFSERYPLSEKTVLKVEAINGVIDIITSENLDSVHVWGERIVKSDSQNDAEEHLELLEVHIYDTPDILFVNTEQPEQSDGRVYIVNYHIELPKSWDAEITHINGNVSMTAFDSNVDIVLTNGNINLGVVRGDLTYSLGNGNIDIDHVYGNVNGSQTNGTFGGSVIIPLTGHCLIGNVNGNMNLSIPETSSAMLMASLTNGSISLSGLDLSDQTISSSSVSGKLGNGNGDITITNVNGDINIDGY